VHGAHRQIHSRQIHSTELPEFVHPKRIDKSQTPRRKALAHMANVG